MLRRRGFTPSSKWLSREISPANRDEVIQLGLSPAAAVTRLRRLRLADGIVMAVENSTFPASVIPDPQAIGDSLYTLSRKSRTVDRARAAAFSRGERERGDRAADGHRAERSAPADYARRLYGRPARDRIDRYLLPQRLLRFRRGTAEVGGFLGDPAATQPRHSRFASAPMATAAAQGRRRLASCSAGCTASTRPNSDSTVAMQSRTSSSVTSAAASRRRAGRTIVATGPFARAIPSRASFRLRWRVASTPSSRRTRRGSRSRDRAPDTADVVGSVTSRCLLLGPRDAARRLHEAIETASRRPRPFVPIRGHRHIDDAGRSARQSPGPKPRAASAPGRYA